jgi:hypothetical protein
MELLQGASLNAILRPNCQRATNHQKEKTRADCKGWIAQIPDESPILTKIQNVDGILVITPGKDIGHHEREATTAESMTWLCMAPGVMKAKPMSIRLMVTSKKPAAKTPQRGTAGVVSGERCLRWGGLSCCTTREKTVWPNCAAIFVGCASADSTSGRPRGVTKRTKNPTTFANNAHIACKKLERERLDFSFTLPLPPAATPHVLEQQRLALALERQDDADPVVAPESTIIDAEAVTANAYE